MEEQRSSSPVQENSGTPFRCPGEPVPISRSLHLARLGSGYSACLDCEHRTETGTLPVSVVKAALTRQAGPVHTLQFERGIRGAYLNVLTREKLARVVEHVLDISADDLLAEQTQPRILVGRDARTSSADLTIGVVNVLRRWGCDVADLGEVSQPCFEFGMEQFHADLGLLVTGGVEPMSQNGLNVYDRDAIPWGAERFVKLQDRIDRPANRFCRQSGRYQTLSVTEIYHSKVSLLFLENCGLRIAYACGDRLTRELLKIRLDESGSESAEIPSNFSEVDFNQQLTRFRFDVRQCEADMGFLIRPDSQTLHVIDERGREVSPADVVQLCSQSDGGNEIDGGTVSAESVSSLEEILRCQRSDKIPIVTQQNRYWFADHSPRCDGLTVVALILQKQAQSDWPLSAQSKQQGTSS